MKTHLVRRDELRTRERLAGMTLCHEVRDAQGATVFTKGAVLSASDIPALMELPWSELHLIEHEMKPNSGKSMKDQANRNEKEMGQIKEVLGLDPQGYPG